MKNNYQPKVIICDDHEIFREGLKLLFEKIDTITLVGEAANGRELINMVETLQPQIVISDIKMPLMDGIEATKIIKKQWPHIHIIALSMFDDENVIVDMLHAGASGYMLKNADKSEFKDAIQTVMDNKIYYCNHTSDKLAQIIAKSKEMNNLYKKEAEFSDREKEIIQLICLEHTNKEIGEKLFLSSRTVEGYRLKILEKMDVKNVAGIVIEAIRMGIFQPV